MECIAKYLIENNLSIASIESFTVGGFANLIGSIPGISKVYRGSMVTYQTEMKQKLLGIPQELIDNYGVVSKEIAYEMVKKGGKLFQSDICLSFTGNSGPLPMENKPVGLCYIGIFYQGKINVYTLHLKGTREEIKQLAINEACYILKNELKIGG